MCMSRKKTQTMWKCSQSIPLYLIYHHTSVTFLVALICVLHIHLSILIPWNTHGRGADQEWRWLASLSLSLKSLFFSLQLTPSLYFRWGRKGVGVGGGLTNKPLCYSYCTSNGATTIPVVTFLYTISVHRTNARPALSWLISSAPKTYALNGFHKSRIRIMLTLKVLVATSDAQWWEGMGDVGSTRYEPALLPPCPTARALSYRN